MYRFHLWAVLSVVFIVQAIAIVLNPIPAQDGLKFIRIARDFRDRPWEDVVRDSDQHPLYPGLISLIQQPVAILMASGPSSWRIAAQLVSIGALLIILATSFRLTTDLAGRQTALIAVIMIASLPIVGKLGHETLSDTTAAACFAVAVMLGIQSIQEGSGRRALGSSVAGGLGFLTRPEIALVIPILALVALSCYGGSTLGKRLRLTILVVLPWGALLVGYAFLNGELSNKLAFQHATHATHLPTFGTGLHAAQQWRPPGLDHPAWDFSPKEESGGPTKLSALSGFLCVTRSVGEASAWFLIPMALVGLLKRPDSTLQSRLRVFTALYCVVFSAILLRHAMTFGYLSSRHAFTLLVAIGPFASIGIVTCFDRLARAFRWSNGRRIRIGWATILISTGIAMSTQLQPDHPSRWGHQAAGSWLADRAKPGDAVLDTRGWASFHSGVRSYDPWHIHQALSDSSLAYIVVGVDELTSETRRADTLNAILNYSSECVASFPSRKGDQTPGVQVFRYRRPTSWEAIRP